MNKIHQEFLEFTKDLGTALEEFLTSPYGQLRISRIPRATYYRKVKKFTTAGLMSKSLGTPAIALTQKAIKLLNKPSKRRRRTDEHSTIIIFDIPIEKNRERGIFRRYLKRNGYTLLQRSMLISPDEMTDETKELIQELGIRKFINIISGKMYYY